MLIEEKLNEEVALTQALGADALVLELVVGRIGVDHDALHAIAAQLLLL